MPVNVEMRRAARARAASSRRLLLAAAIVAAALWLFPAVAQAASGYADTVEGTPGLVSYWRLGESSGGTAVDSKGSDDGSYVGGFTLGWPGALAGDADTSVGFDGIGGEMSAPGPPLPADSGSLEGWFDWQGGVALMRDNTLVGGWILAYDWDGSLHYRLGGTSFDTGVATASVRNGWHHFVATKDGGNVAFYLDGQLKHSASGAGSAAPTPAWHVMRNGGYPQFSQGQADEVAIYAVALSATTVQQHYDAGKGQSSVPPTTSPGGMSVVSVDSTEAALDWGSVWPRDYYIAYLYDAQGAQLRRERSNGPTGNTSSHTWRGLTPCTTYQADATSVSGGAESAKSNRVSFKTTGCQPQPLPPPSAPPPPPPPGSSDTWQGFSNPFNLPPAGWRPYADNSAWNRGTAGATVDPNSQAMVDYLRSTSGGGMSNIASPDPTGASPEYWAHSDDPVYTIHCTKWTDSCELEGVQVRIPRGARPATMWDRQMAVIQPDGTEVDMWEADDPSDTGGTLNISHGGMTRIDGDSTGSDATAAMNGLLAGQFRSGEWQADAIHHAIHLVIDRDNGSYVYPAGKTGASDPAASPIPMGQWFKLNVTDADLAAQPPWRRALYRAMRDYGLFVVDTGGGFAVETENPLTYTAFGATDPAPAWLKGQPDVDQWTDPDTNILLEVATTPSFPFDKLVALSPPPRP